jgi:choline-sulfatase
MANPNILFIIADQLAAQFLGAYGHKTTKTPNLDRLAKSGVVFENAYSSSPLCAPARATIMNGLLPSRTGVYDNAAEFPSAIPTWAHYLRLQGYQTCLSGKMHFVGPDQLHGLQERLTTDIYPPISAGRRTGC